jgi:hypothetical protein
MKERRDALAGGRRRYKSTQVAHRTIHFLGKLEHSIEGLGFGARVRRWVASTDLFHCPYVAPHEEKPAKPEKVERQRQVSDLIKRDIYGN